jgi:hypothetical protein
MMKSNPLVVEVLPTKKSKVKSRSSHDAHIVPKHPFRAILSGASGSGKTFLLLHLLRRIELYKNFFDVIFVISPTAGKLDDSYQALGGKKVKIVNDLDPDIIESIMTANKKIILEKGVHKAPKILIVYDDVISHKKFMNSKSFTHSFIASRHYNASVIIATQKFNAIPKTCRVQANAIFYFKGTNTERLTLADDFAPAGYSNREMEEIIDEATHKPYSFLFINRQAPRGEQLREGLEHILRLAR